MRKFFIFDECEGDISYYDEYVKILVTKSEFRLRVCLRRSSALVDTIQYLLRKQES